MQKHLKNFKNGKRVTAFCNPIEINKVLKRFMSTGKGFYGTVPRSITYLQKPIGITIHPILLKVTLSLMV
jgi:hypothetical protein